MKSKLTKSAAVLAGALAAEAGATDQQQTASQTLYGQGSLPTFTGPEDFFSGDVHVEIAFPDNETANYSGAYVTFRPRRALPGMCTRLGSIWS